MICPLLLIANCILQNGENLDIDCRKAKCAWWEDSAKKCGIKSLVAIALNLRSIASSLDKERKVK